MQTGSIDPFRHAVGGGLGGLLVEREAELRALDQRLAGARRSTGSVVFIEAPAGHGKSRLFAIAADMARAAGMQVLAAQANQLEREYAFSVAVQLLEPRWRSLTDEERAQLSTGPGSWAGALLTGAVTDAQPLPGDRGYALIRGLFWLVRDLVAMHPAEVGASMAILVDDLHWADPLSLRFLAYIAERIAELPIVLVLTGREGERPTDHVGVASLREAASIDGQLHPRSLSDEGVTTIVRSQLPDAESAFCQACARATAGNLFLLAELLALVCAEGARADATTAVALADRPPESVVEAVVSRLAAMSAEPAALASAVAVLGDGTALRTAAALARLDLEIAGRAADTLAALDLFHPGEPLAFVHPLVGSAVRSSLSPLERGHAHRRAASVLLAEGAREEQVAAHLLASPPAGDAAAVELLRAAARKALARGAADSAIRLLERAVEEEPSGEAYSEILAELGRTELSAGLPQALQRLEQALSLTNEQPRRIELAVTHGHALRAEGRYAEAAKVFATALEETDEDSTELREELEAAYIATATVVPALSEDARRRGDEMRARVGERPTAGQRTALAHLAWLCGLRGEDRGSVVSLAKLAWGGGTLVAAGTTERPLWSLLTDALLFVDEIEFALKIHHAVVVQDGRLAPRAGSSADGFIRPWPRYHQGWISDAMSTAERLSDLDPDKWQSYAHLVHGTIAAGHIQRGMLHEADQALSVLAQSSRFGEFGIGFLLDVRAQLRLAQRRPKEALADATEAGRRAASSFGEVAPGAIAWRSTAALAYLALGDRAAASRLAREELEWSEAIGVTRVVIRDLRVLGLAQDGEKRLASLHDAVTVGENYPPRLEHIHALIELGGALRRANQRSAARQPLRRGLELSHRAGATALADYARRELAAAGSRPRRASFSGPEALTASELRVAELAGQGLTTREMAAALYVSPKTVEFHLRHIYAKLDVRSRAELAGALERQPEDVAS